VKVDHLDSIRLQDRQEERRKGRYHSSKDGEEEEQLRRCRQGVWQRPAVPDANGSPLTVLAPNHLAYGLELSVTLDARLEQRCHHRRCCPGGSSCFCGPAGFHLAAS
jgi:hypothetical protein